MLLQQSRLAAGLSHEALAERAGLSTDAVAALERGRRTAPRPTTIALLVEALQLTPSERAALVAAARPAASPPSITSAPAALPLANASSLPIQPTSLVGRERDVGEVARLLGLPSPAGRLVTLIGPGGVGKTRLALAVAAAVQAEYAEGAWFVDLAPLRDERLVPSTIAWTLGVREEGGQSARDLLIGHLRTRDVLLVLDNFENVLGAAPVVADLLSACPGLRMLVTSRAVLRLRSEQRFQVPPLAAAVAGAMQHVAVAPAVQLFVDRAQSVDPTFVLGEQNAGAISQICRRLDGLPLAIELAAAHADVLAPHALLARLDHGFNLLAYGPRDLPARQRTPRATIDWSYALLGQPEQALFRRLSVFAGSWTLEEAEGVSPTGAVPDVVPGLQILVDHSLVRASSASASGTRFQMLETIRGYGLDQLVACGEVDDARQSHLTYFQKLANDARARVFGAEQVLWLDALEQELDNLRAALDFAPASSDPATLDRGLCLAGTLWRFWYLRCFLSEGRAWLSEFLKVGGSPPTRLDALVGLSTITSLQTDYDPAVAAAQEGVALARDLDDRLNLSILLNTLAGVARNRDDFASAVALGEESVAVSRSLGDDWSLALSLHNLADLARLQGDYTRGEALAQHSLGLAARAADNWGNTLWFTEATKNQIGHITTTGEITEYPIQMSGASPMGIARDADGNLVFAEQATGQLVTFDLAPVVNDTNPEIVYTGSWSTQTNRAVGDFGGNVHYTTTNGDSATSTFDGTSVAFITELSVDKGQIAVYLDGTLKTENAVSAGHNLGGHAIFTMSGLPKGSHTLKVMKQSGQYMLVDAFKVS